MAEQQLAFEFNATETISYRAADFYGDTFFMELSCSCKNAAAFTISAVSAKFAGDIFAFERGNASAKPCGFNEHPSKHGAASHGFGEDPALRGKAR